MHLDARNLIPNLLLCSAILLILSACGMADDSLGSMMSERSATDSGAPGGGSNNNGSNQGGNTNVSFGGAQDFGYFRRLLDAGQVPQTDEFDAEGFFAEHHTPLPEPLCGERMCVQAMLGVMHNLVDGSASAMLQLGLNSPITVDAADRPPLTLALVVDVSGSMAAGGKIDFVRDGLHQMVDALPDGDQLTLITYSSDVAVVFDMAPVASNREALHAIVGNLAAGGSTNLYAGLERGYIETLSAYDSGRQNRVIMLSDGVPTAGITDSESIVSMSRAYNADGVGLTSVGLGTDFNYALMRDLALQADGNFYFVEDSSAVSEVFTEELEYFTLPVAYDVTLELQTGPDYDFGRAIGTPFWEDTTSGGKVELPSVFLAHRTAHDDVTPDGDRRGGGSALLTEMIPRDNPGADSSADVAIVHLSFREPGSDQTITDNITVVYPHPATQILSTGYFDGLIVEKSFVMLNIFDALKKACATYHAGLGGDAIEMLMLVMAAAVDYEATANDGTGDVDIQLDIALMQQLIDVMQLNGATTPPDVAIPADPWPAN